MSTPSFDIHQAHRYFAGSCFNAAWDLIDKSARTTEDNEQMVLLAQASLWHWTQREDRTSRNLSIGYWQLARVNALLHRGEEARRAAQECLQHAAHEPPFYVGYAHEALARAARVLGQAEEFQLHLEQAQRQAAVVSDESERKALEADLTSLQ